MPANEVKTQYSDPFWANGDGSGVSVNKLDYLATCGIKSIHVEAFTWVGGDSNPCDSMTLQLTACEEPKTMPMPLLPAAPQPTRPVPTPPLPSAPLPTPHVPVPTMQPPVCSNFICPTNSFPKTGCASGPEDCACKAGYVKENHACVKPCFQCPSNSVPNWWLFFSCPKSLSDCVCSHGYEFQNNVCVKTCTNFHCPMGTVVKQGLSCISGPHDCEASCPNFHCPSGFKPKVGVACIHGLQDCVEISCNGTLIFGVCIPNIQYAPSPSPPTFPTPSSSHPNGLRAEYCQLRRNTKQIRFEPTTSEIGVNGIKIKTAHGHSFTFHPPQFSREYSLSDQDYNTLLNAGSFQLAYIGSNDWISCEYRTPIGLDLDRSGSVERIQGEFHIDLALDGSGSTLQEWFAPTEGILIDTTFPIVDGLVTGKHLFGDEGNKYHDGFEKMDTLLDSNGDHLINNEELENLMIWRDTNSNAHVDKNELKPLDYYGIIALSSFHQELESYAVLDDGTLMMMEDLLFAR